VVLFRASAVGFAIATVMILSGWMQPIATARAEGRVVITAYLDGLPIPISEVSKHYCDDFSYPVISCSASPLVQTLRTTSLSLLATVDYVTIYEQPSFAGSWMNVSQDYSVLSFIGWNDRISSFRGRNSETGRFTTDWLYGGSQWSFCCNAQQTTLGGYDNTFSSIQRT
jgi:hypothetical protein